MALYGALFCPGLTNGASFAQLILHDLSFTLFQRISGGISHCTRWAVELFPANGLKLFFRGSDRTKILGTFLPSGFTARDAMVRAGTGLFWKMTPAVKDQMALRDFQLR
jgi:hypothetical protein